MHDIAILVHRQHELYAGYVLSLIADVWRDQGVRVTVLRGPMSGAEADLAVLHVDLTVGAS